jgi:Ca-activated chloride channel family protein
MAQESTKSGSAHEVPATPLVEGVASSPEGQIFRANSRLVELYATVMDANGRYLDDLTQDLFNIQDGGKPANIIAFESRTSEVSVALLLDTTGSMLNALPALKSAAIHLIDELRPADSVAVYSFNSSVQELQSFTTEKAPAKRAVLGTHPYGETAMYDALTRVGRDLADRPGKKVIVLFTDGDDNSSTLTTGIAVRRAKAAGIPVYTVAQGEALRNPAFVDQLAAVSKSTGAQSFIIHEPREIKGVFDKVSEDLSHGYLLMLQPEATDDPAWRVLDLELRGVKGAKIRSREGYYPE